MLSTLITLWLLHVAALLSPGANVLLVSQLAASDHARSARYAAFGITLGALIWSTSAVLGVHAFFVAFPALRTGLQVAGGVYLLYVSIRLWRSSAVALSGEQPAVGALAAFRLGFLTNITNPKSALFFGSVFAASFPASPTATLQAAAVAMVVVNAFFWHVLLAYVFSRSSVRAAYARARGTFNRVAALALGTLGLGLLLATLREARA